MNALQIIQQKLKAPKSQFNSFGKYSYRNQEDILEAVKPLLTETNSTLIVSDEIVEIGGKLFVKSIAVLTDADGKVWHASAYAEHATEQKGMNPAQITGSTSSYARKYALNGLFLIDDTKDADATNDHGKGEKAPEKTEAPKPKEEKKKPVKVWLNPGTKEWTDTVSKMTLGTPIETVETFFLISKDNRTKLIAEAKPQTI